MPKRLHVESSLSAAALETRYRKAKDPVERTHFQILWMVVSGKVTREVAEATSYSPGWIREIVRRYNERGSAGLGDGRHRNPGRVAILSAAQQAELRTLLEQPPVDGGLWNSRKVAAWIEAQTGKRVGLQRGWAYLRRLGYTPHVPRPTHAQAAPDAQAAFKKTAGASAATPARIQQPRSSAGPWMNIGWG